MDYRFANSNMSASAQPACVASSCAFLNNCITMILNAGILLAFILILPIIMLVGSQSDSVRIMARHPVSSLCA